MSNNGLQFGGFEGKAKKEKDLPPRPIPQPLPTKPSNSWSPDVPPEDFSDDSRKRLIVNIVNILLPVIGLTIILGFIVVAVIGVVQFYNK